MTTERRLTNHPSMNCRVCLHDDGTIVLRSYATNVVEIDPDGWLVCAGLYSATTRKHISLFVREYTRTMNYYDVKKAFENGYRINIHTGEIEFL